MKVEQLPSGTYRVRIMIDGHRYTFTDKDKLRVKAKAAQFADDHREAVANPTLMQAMDTYIESRSKTRSAALTDKALNHFDSMTKFVTK